MKIRFLTGEMAQLHGISKQTLIYYDKIGLLSPREVDPDTEYRYYHLDQFEDLELILILKNLGMHLREIKVYRSQATPSARLELLESQREVVQKKVEQFQKMQHRLETMVGNVKNSLKIQPFSKGIRWVGERRMFSIAVASPHDLYQMELSFKEMFRHTKVTGDADTHDFLVIVGDSPGGKERFEKISVPACENSNDIIPAGYHAYINHQGPFSAVKDTRKQLLNYIENTGYTVTGPAIERVLLSNLEVADETEYLVEVMIPVEAENNDGFEPERRAE